MQSRTREQIGRALDHRHHHHHDSGKYCEENGHRRKLIAQEQENPDDHQDAIEGRGGPVQHEPDPFTGGRRRHFRLWLPQEITLGQVGKIPACPMLHIRNFQIVHEHVVAIKPQQGIGVEQHGGDAGNQDRVIRQHPHEAGLRIDPHDQRQRSQGQFDHHAGRAHKNALPLAPESPRPGGFNIGYGGKDQQHHPEFMHFRTERLRHEAVPQLMAQL